MIEIVTLVMLCSNVIYTALGCTLVSTVLVQGWRSELGQGTPSR